MGDRPRPSGEANALGAANLPYLVAIVVSLAVLIPFLMLGHPFTPKEDSSAAASTSTTAAVVTTGGETTTTTGITTTGATTVTTGGSGLTGFARGEEIFNATCIACHGAGGVGVEGLGKPLTTSTFADGLSDDELVAFLVVGRLDTDPLNTTGIAMPPRGGNPSLTDADLADVVTYLRTLGPAA